DWTAIATNCARRCGSASSIALSSAASSWSIRLSRNRSTRSVKVASPCGTLELFSASSATRQLLLLPRSNAVGQRVMDAAQCHVNRAYPSIQPLRQFRSLEPVHVTHRHDALGVRRQLIQALPQ